MVCVVPRETTESEDKSENKLIFKNFICIEVKRDFYATDETIFYR